MGLRDDWIPEDHVGLSVFHKTKSVQREYKYFFMFEFKNLLSMSDDFIADDGFSQDIKSINTTLYNMTNETIGNPRVLQSFVYTSITNGTPSFSKNTVKYGTFSRSFATLPEESTIPLKLVMQEDRYGNVLKFIHLLQKRNMTRDGYHRPPNQQYLPPMILDIVDDQDLVQGQYTFLNGLFLGADEVTRSYAGSDTISYSLNFTVDFATYNDVDFGTGGADDRTIVPIPLRLARYAAAAAKRAAAQAYDHFKGSGDINI